jgi:CDP-diacylglycerol--serine O-phosphatidyltransferase
MANEQRHFSMIRDFQLADLITLANGFCGTGAVLSLLKYAATSESTWLWVAFALLPLALVADVADGRVARHREAASPLGKELDSLADLISFGVAPASIGFALGMQGALDAVALIFFVGCGISRLARYNVTAAALAGPGGKVRYYEGTPIPSSLLLVLIMALLANAGRIGDRLLFGELSLGFAVFHPLSLLFVINGATMVSKTLRIPKP